MKTITMHHKKSASDSFVSFVSVSVGCACVGVGVGVYPCARYAVPFQAIPHAGTERREKRAFTVLSLG